MFEYKKTRQRLHYKNLKQPASFLYKTPVVLGN